MKLLQQAPHFSRQRIWRVCWNTTTVASRPSDAGREHCGQRWTEGGVLRIQRLDVETRQRTNSTGRQPHQRTTVLCRFRSGRCLHVVATIYGFRLIYLISQVLLIMHTTFINDLENFKTKY